MIQNTFLLGATTALVLSGLAAGAPYPVSSPADLNARGLDQAAKSIAGTAARKVYTAAGKKEIGDKVKDYLKPPPPANVVPLAEAAKKVSPPFSQQAMDAQRRKKTRALDSDFDMYARGLDQAAKSLAGTAARKVYTAAGKKEIGDKVKDYLKPPPPAIAVPLAEASKKAGGPFSQQAVDTHHKMISGKKMRRGLDQAAKSIAGTAARKVYTAVGKKEIGDKVKDYLKPPPPANIVPLAEAAKKASPPFSQQAIDAQRRKKTRALEFGLELDARGLDQAAKSIAGTAARKVYTAAGKKEIGDKVKDYLKPPPPAIVYPLAEASKKAGGPFSQQAIDAHQKMITKKTRALAVRELLELIEARGWEMDDLE